jgi:uncharacterized membrane protein
MAELIVLRLIHVLGGLIWVGSAVFSGFLLMPALAKLGPTAGAVMAGLKDRGLFVILPTVAILTILSGLRLMWLVSGGFATGYFTTASGATYAAAGACAILAFVLGLTISRPLGARVGALGAELARATDQTQRANIAARLATAQRSSAVLGVVLTLLLVGGAAGMAIARYLV